MVLGHGLHGEAHQLLAGQGAGGSAGFGDEGFYLAKVVGAGMEFQIGKQFAFGFGKFFGAGYELDAQTLGGCAQRVALGGYVFGFHEAFFFERLQYGGAVLYFLF